MRTLLLIGTRKGGFIASSDAARRSWTLEGPFLKGCEVNHVAYAPGSGTIVLGNGGDDWDVIFNWLPPIYSVDAVVVK